MDYGMIYNKRFDDEKAMRVKGEYSIGDFAKIVADLRSQENGCGWDKVQTHSSIKVCLTNEAAEVIEAIDKFDNGEGYENLCEELGDVLLQVVMHAQMASEKGMFDLADVIDGISEKMIRRHPRVFPEAVPEGIDAKSLTWEEIKSLEKGRR